MLPENQVEVLCATVSVTTAPKKWGRLSALRKVSRKSFLCSSILNPIPPLRNSPFRDTISRKRGGQLCSFSGVSYARSTSQPDHHKDGTGYRTELRNRCNSLIIEGIYPHVRAGMEGMVARPGLEPGQTDPESVVLPLHHRADGSRANTKGAL